MTTTRLLVLFAAAFGACVEARASSLAFTVSMPDPASHRFHVTLRCEGLTGGLQDFKMPAWTPGYYRIMDYARNVSGFRAEDSNGHALPWEKTTRNAWRVASAGSPVIVLHYDVTGTIVFAAQNFLDEKRAYISPTALFLHVAGHIEHPVTVQFEPPADWHTLATGLDAVPGKRNTYKAPDFDILYDSPILMGNQEWLSFEAAGRAHRVAIESVPASIDRPKILADLKRIVEAATTLMGDVPYRHYTFLLMGNGAGGIEHLNSASIAFNGNSLTSESGYRNWLSFVAHEYFHNFNVKRIRPLALGPFDYDQESFTNLLWVSEGLSVYYQDLLILRAGLITREQYLDRLGSAITQFENKPGRRYQSAIDSSATTWGTSGVGGDRNITISYYDNGGILGVMLDLAIRNASGNRRSLDDVMRALYRTYYQQEQRGFTDAEFREECERAAGGSLAEMFEHAADTRDYDYGRHFALAGLDVSFEAQDAPGVSLGLNFQTRDGRLMVGADDQVLEVDGAKATARSLSDLLASKRPGDSIKLRIARNGAVEDVNMVLARNTKRTYSIRTVTHPTAAQAAILKDWLRGGGS